jgi:DNA-binding transcriptional ArsR family regulator
VELARGAFAQTTNTTATIHTGKRFFIIMAGSFPTVLACMAISAPQEGFRALESDLREVDEGVVKDDAPSDHVAQRRPQVGVHIHGGVGVDSGAAARFAVVPKPPITPKNFRRGGNGTARFALSDSIVLPPRLSACIPIPVLNLLRMGSMCVCDLQALLGITQPTVSRHLGVLRHTGLVLDEREGPRVWYSLAPATTPQLGAFHAFLERVCSCEDTFGEDLENFREALGGNGIALRGSRFPSKHYIEVV